MIETTVSGDIVMTPASDITHETETPTGPLSPAVSDPNRLRVVLTVWSVPTLVESPETTDSSNHNL